MVLQAKQIAEQIVKNPRLRAQCLQDPFGAVKRAVPAKQFRLGVDSETLALRDEVIAALADEATLHPEVWSSQHAEAVIRQFFDQAIRNPQWSFVATLVMSCSVFAIGLALTATGLLLGTTGEDQSLAAVFGASGVFGTLGAVFALARNGVNTANANHAQIRLILASFATELGHLRALDLQDLGQVAEVNDKIREAMDTAVRLIQDNVKSEGGAETSKPEAALPKQGAPNPAPA